MEKKQMFSYPCLSEPNSAEPLNFLCDPRTRELKFFHFLKLCMSQRCQNTGETVTPMQLQSSLPRVHKARHFNILDSPKKYS